MPAYRIECQLIEQNVSLQNRIPLFPSRDIFAAATAQQIPGLAGDVTSAGPLKAMKAGKSVSFIKDSNVLLIDQLSSQGKIIAALIKVLKSSNNL